MTHMMKNLEIERLTLAAMSLGIARRSVEEMNRYASERQSFGKDIRRFGQIQKHIGDSWAKYRAIRSYTYDTAHSMNLGGGNQRLDSDGIKLLPQLQQRKLQIQPFR